ncbi:hypothetical protein ACU4GD_15325 [Cupriavidus basilensis]
MLHAFRITHGGSWSRFNIFAAPRGRYLRGAGAGYHGAFPAGTWTCPAGDAAGGRRDDGDATRQRRHRRLCPPNAAARRGARRSARPRRFTLAAQVTR